MMIDPVMSAFVNQHAPLLRTGRTVGDYDFVGAMEAPPPLQRFDYKGLGLVADDRCNVGDKALGDVGFPIVPNVSKGVLDRPPRFNFTRAPVHIRTESPRTSAGLTVLR